MGLQCRISYDRNGTATVTDEFGQESGLYQDLLESLGSQKLALDYWVVANDPELLGKGESTTVVDIVSFLDSHAAMDQKLSPAEKLQVVDFMKRNRFTSLDDLYNQLAKIFKPRGFFEIDAEEAVNSGLFTTTELNELDTDQVQDILLKIEGQLAIEDVTTEFEEAFDEYIDTGRKTIFGTNQRVSQTEIDNSIIRAVENLQDKDSFLQGLRTLPYTELTERFEQDEAFANEMMAKFKNLKKLPVLSIVNGELSAQDNEVFVTTRNTIMTGHDTKSVEADLDYLNGIPQDVWEENAETVKEVLREVEESFAEMNIDVVGIADKFFDRAGVMDLLVKATLMAKNVNPTAIGVFAESYNKLIGSPNTIITQSLEDVYMPYNIVSLHSNMSERALFDKFGLIKIADNVYHKVDNTASLDDVREAIYVDMLEGRLEIPSEYITVSNFRAPENKTKVLENISEYLMSRPTNQKFANQELYSAYQVIFRHLPVEDKVKDVQGLTKVKTDEDYLKTDFVSDFYNYILREKAKRSEIYNTTLSKFRVTDRDITMVEPIDSIEHIEFREELQDYIRIHRDSNMKELITNEREDISEDLLYINFPEKLAEFEGQMIMEGDFVIVQPTAADYIKINGELYRKEALKEDAELFVKITTPRDSVYYTSSQNFSFDKEQGNLLMNTFGFLDNSTTSYENFLSILAKSRINDNMDSRLKELSTLKDKSYVITEEFGSFVAKKDGVEVARLSFDISPSEYSRPKLSISEEHSGKGVGTQLYLQLFDKALKTDRTVGRPDVETQQSENVFDRVENAVGDFLTSNVRFQMVRTATRDSREGANMRPRRALPDFESALLDRLQQTGLANNVFVRDSEGISSEMKSLGISVNVARQVLEWHSERDAKKSSKVGEFVESLTEEQRENLQESEITITPNGFVHNGDVYINKDSANLTNTIIHEFGHLFNSWARENRKDIYDRGMELIKSEEGKYYVDLVSEMQPNLKGERLYEEALTQAIGDRGENITNENKRKGFREWLQELWNAVKFAIGIREATPEQLSEMTLEQFTRAVANDMMKGEEFETNPYSISIMLDPMISGREGKMISTASIRQVLNQPGVKQIEKDIINEVLELEGFKGKKKIPHLDFKAAVNMRVMPLNVKESPSYASYGVERTWPEYDEASTHIYTTDIDHGVKGHFSGDFNTTETEIEFEIKRLGTEYVVVRSGVLLTEQNLQDNVFTTATSEEQARVWIENYSKSKKAVGGLFGHSRVWTQNLGINEGGKTSFIAEIQSDSYQKKNAIDLVMSYYLQNQSKVDIKLLGLLDQLDDARSLVNNFRFEERENNSRLERVNRHITEHFRNIDQKQSRIDKMVDLGDKRDHIEYDIEVLEIEIESLDRAVRGEEVKPIKVPEPPKGYPIKSKHVNRYSVPGGFIYKTTKKMTVPYINGKQYEGENVKDIFETLYELDNNFSKITPLSGVKQDLKKFKTVGDVLDFIADHTIEDMSYSELLAEADKYYFKIGEVYKLEEKRFNKALGLKYETAANILDYTFEIAELKEVLTSFEKDAPIKLDLADVEVFTSSFNIPDQTTLDRVVEIYEEKDYNNRYKVNPIFREGIESARAESRRLEKQFIDSLPIEHKQFIAHRKNYSERIIREEIRRAADNNYNSVAFPDVRTLAVIEGYIDNSGYEVIEGDRTGGNLYEGDKIRYLGDPHVVVRSTNSEIEVLLTEGLEYIEDIDKYRDDYIDKKLQDDLSKFDEFIESEQFTAETWEEAEIPDSIKQLRLSDITRNTFFDEETGEEIYEIGRELIEKELQTAYEEAYINAEDIIGETTDDYIIIERFGEPNSMYYTESVMPSTEMLSQPRMNAALSENFNTSNMTKAQQTVLKNHASLLDKFKKWRGDNIFEVTDDKGNLWFRSDITQEDKSTPIVAFQVPGPAIQTSKMENISSIFDSQLELLDLYSSKEEAQIKKDIDCEG